MKKLFILLLLMTAVFTANAQELTIKQVLEKSFSAMNAKKHSIKGNITTKVLGKELTVYCATDGVNSYTAAPDGSTISYNNKGVQYDYRKKKNTVTITNSEFNDPFFGELIDEIKADMDKDDMVNTEMELKNGEYTIIGKDSGAKITFVIDAKTFFFKSLKMKKFLLSLEMKYSNLAYFTNNESLIYNASKFPNAKIVDKRKKKK